MSVINKMLRDLDDRQAAGSLQVRAQDGRTGIARDTLSVDPQGGKGRSLAGRRTVAIAASVMALALAAGGAWWWVKVPRAALPADTTAQAPQPAAGIDQAVVPKAALPSSSASAPKPVPRGTLPKNSPESSAAGASAKGPGLPGAGPKPALPVLAEGMSTPIPAVVPKGKQPDQVMVPEAGLRMDTAVKALALNAGASSAPAPARVAAPTTPVPTLAPPLPASQSAPGASPARQQSPVMEALAQSQALWNAGSRAAGIELLRDAMAVAERAATPGPVSSSSPLPTLARELARMELAEGRVAAALEMLVRLESNLSGVADIWALRGNAAQRLGRHEESSTAYLTALKLRPNEPRWMLGAAVSLAAQGQTSAAAEWAEQARAAGALSRELATYLQQLGVTLRER